MYFLFYYFYFIYSSTGAAEGAASPGKIGGCSCGEKFADRGIGSPTRQHGSSGEKKADTFRHLDLCALEVAYRYPIDESTMTIFRVTEKRMKDIWMEGTHYRPYTCTLVYMKLEPVCQPFYVRICKHLHKWPLFS